jgi:hypothetical protein
LVEKKHKNEAAIQRFKEEQRNLSEEGKRLRSEVEQHRIDKENLGQGKFEQDRNMSKMQVRMEGKTMGPVFVKMFSEFT